MQQHANSLQDNALGRSRTYNLRIKSPIRWVWNGLINRVVALVRGGYRRVEVCISPSEIGPVPTICPTMNRGITKLTIHAHYTCKGVA
jgi:hypothetical protein